MPRLTVTLSERHHCALKQESVRTGKTIRELIEQSLESAGIKTSDDAAAIVARARVQAALSDGQATALAIEETRAHRRAQ